MKDEFRFSEAGAGHPRPPLLFKNGVKISQKRGIWMRTCRTCGERKNKNRFAVDKNAPSGRVHICRVCEKAAAEAVHFDAFESIETREDEALEDADNGH